MTATEALAKHGALSKRRTFSLPKLKALSEKLESLRSTKGCDDVCIFAAGSLGRLEAGPQSDLDLFLISKGGNHTSLQKTRLLAAVADINDELGFPAFSGDMRFFKLYSSGELIDHTGKPVDDTENSFTARMLLLLESRVVAGSDVFDSIALEISENYFRDNKGKKDFKPLFLLNDLLRYWRTLCLNYEGSRSDPTKLWRKKNLNLRFSRLSTVFSTVTALLATSPNSATEFVRFIPMTPFERLSLAIDAIPGEVSMTSFIDFLDDYEWFLQLKDDKGAEKILSDELTKREAKERAEAVAQFFQATLSSDSLKGNSRFLML